MTRGVSSTDATEALEAVRVTAERVHRFAAAVESDPSLENRGLWRGSLADLRAAIRDARSAGISTTAIQAVTAELPTGRFVRTATVESPQRAIAG